MTDPTDLIAQADAALALDPPSVIERAKLTPALRDALAAERARVVALEEEVARLRDALEEAACYGCTCDPAYYERGLAAPDCLANLVSDDAREALGKAAVCKGSAAARAALTGEPQP